MSCNVPSEEALLPFRGRGEASLLDTRGLDGEKAVGGFADAPLLIGDLSPNPNFSLSARFELLGAPDDKIGAGGRKGEDPRECGADCPPLGPTGLVNWDPDEGLYKVGDAFCCGTIRARF